MNEKKWYQKWILTLAFIITLSTTNTTVYSKNNLETKEEELDQETKTLEEIITIYQLENNRDFIMSHSEDFYQYYETIVNNPHMQESDIKEALKDFWIFINYFDIKTAIEKLEEYNLEGDEQNSIDDLTKSYEMKRYYFDHKEQEVLYLKNGQISNPYNYDKTIEGYAIQEGICSDLASMNSPITGIPKKYHELYHMIQAFYLIYGRDEFLKEYAKPNFLANFYHELLNNLSPKEVIDFFDNMNALKNFSVIEQKRVLIVEEKREKESCVINLCETLIHIYETTKKEDWKNSNQLQAILYAMIKPITNLENKPELESLQKHPTFLNDYYIDLSDVISTTVIIDSSNQYWPGEFCFIYQNKHPIEQTEIDTFCYAFENGKMKNINSFNTEKKQQEILLKSYGMTNDAEIQLCLDTNFFSFYEKIILNVDLLSKEEQFYFIKHFIDFVTLHQTLFESASPDYIQELLTKAINSCKTREEIYDIFLKENMIYVLGAKELIQELTKYGITDFQIQKCYIQNNWIFQSFQEGLNQNSSLTKEQRQEIILLFPNYVDTLSNQIMIPDQAKWEIINQIQNLTYSELKFLLRTIPKENGKGRIIYAFA